MTIILLYFLMEPLQRRVSSRSLLASGLLYFLLTFLALSYSIIHSVFSKTRVYDELLQDKRAVLPIIPHSFR